MIHVGIDRPVREHDVWVLGGEETRHRVYVPVCQLRGAIDLTEELGTGTDDAAGRLALCRPDPRRFVQRLAGDAALAAREIDDGYGVAAGRVAGQRTTAARLRIVGVPADADDFQDRKSTRLNSSHANISYAVFCLKKEK